MRDTFLLSRNSHFSEARPHDYETVVVMDEKKYEVKIFVAASQGKPKIVFREMGVVQNMLLPDFKEAVHGTRNGEEKGK